MPPFPELHVNSQRVGVNLGGSISDGRLRGMNTDAVFADFCFCRELCFSGFGEYIGFCSEMRSQSGFVTDFEAGYSDSESFMGLTRPIPPTWREGEQVTFKVVGWGSPCQSWYKI